jgi:hypothetical protein
MHRQLSLTGVNYAQNPAEAPLRLRQTNSESGTISPAMSDQPLTRPEVEALQRQLSLLTEPAVRDAYAQAHARCCLGRGGLPNPADVQRFLSAWKVLWRWEQNGKRRK